MARKSLILPVLAAIFLLPVKTNAALIGCNLNSTGPYAENQVWTADFDLGVAFTEISSVYIDFCGSIGASAYMWLPSGPVESYDAYFKPQLYELGSGTPLGSAYLYGGQGTYPAPEAFDTQLPLAVSDFSPLLDGIGTIKIGFHPTYPMETVLMEKVEDAFGHIDCATLVFDGTVVPEPTTVLLLAFGALALRKKHRRP
ncbi:MAG: PEP-CTERM sorting domain-containing protein [Planctomycetota bacterium]|jgi:hypothetical protein